MKRVLLLGLLLGAASCATAPADIAFNAVSDQPDAQAETVNTSSDAMIVVAIGPIGTGGALQFQKLNEDQTDFGAEPVLLGFGTWGIGDKMQRPADDKSSIWVLDQNEINFLIKKVDPGLYAANYFTWNTYNGVSSGYVSNCLSEGANVFDLKPGTISLVSSRDAYPHGTLTRLPGQITDEQILEQFALTRKNYPGLIGEADLIEPSLQVRWTEQRAGFFGASCAKAEPDTLTAMRLQASANDLTVPDEADKSAINAALLNLSKASSETDTTGDID